MREIIFRGKLPSGAWVYGDLRQYPSGAKAIKSTDFTSLMEVDPRTVGQYTGLADKNGTKIFEGDIIERNFTLTRGPIKETREKQVGYVDYDCITGGYLIRGACNLRRQWKGDTIEVIGSVYDNPELLEVRNG